MDPKLALTHLSASDVPLRLLLARTVLSLCGATLPTALHSPIALALLLALALPRAGVLVLTAASTHWGTLAPRYAANVLGSWRFSPEACFTADFAPPDVAATRAAAFAALLAKLQRTFPESGRIYADVGTRFSDIRFFDVKKIFFPFADMAQQLAVCVAVKSTSGAYLVDADDNRLLDVSGSYGVNVIGYDAFTKLANANHNAHLSSLGPVLGPIHPNLASTLSLLSEFSGQPECSLHMSGTEAVMAAVRLCRFNTGRPLVASFAAAYHGWYDGLQPGVGGGRPVPDVIVLNDMSPLSLTTIAARASELACVIVNPLQAFTPNNPPPSDGVLMGKARSSGDDAVAGARDKYRQWLLKLRKVCDDAGVVLLFDEVYTGFRLAPGGAQEYFGVRADMVCYGKALAGGMPVGAVCGPSRLMKRYDPDHPLNLCYVVGTFSAHPAVVLGVEAFLNKVKEMRTEYETKHALWDRWVGSMNAELSALGHPVRLAHFASVWLFQYTTASRYHWLMQYYLRSHLVNLAWVGTGRLSFSLDVGEPELAELRTRILAACDDMRAGGWWWEAGKGHAGAIKRRVGGEILWSIAVSVMGALGVKLGGRGGKAD